MREKYFCEREKREHFSERGKERVYIRKNIKIDTF